MTGLLGIHLTVDQTSLGDVVLVVSRHRCRWGGRTSRTLHLENLECCLRFTISYRIDLTSLNFLRRKMNWLSSLFSSGTENVVEQNTSFVPKDKLFVAFLREVRTQTSQPDSWPQFLIGLMEFVECSIEVYQRLLCCVFGEEKLWNCERIQFYIRSCT